MHSLSLSSQGWLCWVIGVGWGGVATTVHIGWPYFLNPRSEPMVQSRVSRTEGGKHIFPECSLPWVLWHGPPAQGDRYYCLAFGGASSRGSCDLGSGRSDGSRSYELLTHAPLIQTRLESGALKSFETPGDLVSFIPFTYCTMRDHVQKLFQFWGDQGIKSDEGSCSPGTWSLS